MKPIPFTLWMLSSLWFSKRRNPMKEFTKYVKYTNGYCLGEIAINNFYYELRKHNKQYKVT